LEEPGGACGGHFGGFEDEVVGEGVGSLGVVDAGVADSGEHVVGGSGDVEEPVGEAGGILLAAAGGEMVAVGGEGFKTVPEGFGDIVGGGDGAEARGAAFDAFGCGGVIDLVAHRMHDPAKQSP